MKRDKEGLIRSVLFAVSAVSILVLVLIFVFLLKEGFSTFVDTGAFDLLLGRRWEPTAEPEIFGILPLILGSIWVTAGAVAIALPLGVAIAVYLAEVAPAWLREWLKPLIEVLAAIPSVVIGFLGLVILAPFIKELFGLDTGFTAFTGSVTLGIMALPTVVSIAEDAISAVPEEYRAASLALGASQWETIITVIVPAAASGLVAAAMLGVGRVIGETMAVLMVTGNAASIPHTLLQPVRTMTATIAAEMGETVRFSDHYHALFAVGLTLFIITFAINLVADLAVRKGGRSA